VRPTIVPVPTPAEAAALAAAIDAVLAEERPAFEGAEVPAAYRSAWRRAALLEGVRGPDGASAGGAR
jgi:hypothetical protein